MTRRTVMWADLGDLEMVDASSYNKLEAECRKFAEWVLDANDGDHYITSDEQAQQAQAWLNDHGQV
jgi:hypothetical protein